LRFVSLTLITTLTPGASLSCCRKLFVKSGPRWDQLSLQRPSCEKIEVPRGAPR
jgi:hypothetical protein